MFRVEFLGAAVTLTIIWLATFAYALTQGDHPQAWVAVLVVTVATVGGWMLVWARHVRQELKEVRMQVRHLQEERDVNEAMHRLRPNLRIVSHDN